MSAERLEFGDDEFDLVAATEVLEHVADPRAVLAEMARVARRHLLVSVPREPLWRALNVARGAYVRQLGNTPGHLNHWSRRFIRCPAGALRRRGADPLAVPVDDAAGAGRLMSSPTRQAAPGELPDGDRSAPGEPSAGTPGQGEDPSFASGARILSIGIASTGIFTFAYLATASHVLNPAAYGRISLCWAIMFVILSVIYRPIEQLLSRTIADRRARGLHGHPLRVPAADPERIRAPLPGRSHSRCGRRSRTGSSTAPRRSTGSS